MNPQGLYIGIVKKISGDPESLSRILVTLNAGTDDETDVWAAMSHTYITDGAGLVFMPEIEDRVIIGFLNGDSAIPVVLGSLYRKTSGSPFIPEDDKNDIKLLTTKSKLSITFNEDEKSIVIATPGKNTITLSDDLQSIEIKDQNSNEFKMTPAGISLKSAKDIELNAAGNITLNSSAGKVSINATQDVEVTGMNVNHTAQVGFSAKGAATAELSASGQTTVKGAMVMIN